MLNELDFAARLKMLSPSKEDMIKKNLPEDFVDNFLQRYICIKRTSFKRPSFLDNTLLNLVSNFDCSKIEIGIISFLPEFVEKPSFYYVGNAEQDIIVLDKTFLSVNVVDAFYPDHIIWKCASNAENFLEALLVAADFFTSRVKDTSLLTNESYTLERASICSEIAGGDAYLKFYKMLFGYNE